MAESMDLRDHEQRFTVKSLFSFLTVYEKLGFVLIRFTNELTLNHKIRNHTNSTLVLIKNLQTSLAL